MKVAEEGRVWPDEIAKLRAEHVIEEPERHEAVDWSVWTEKGPKPLGIPATRHCDSCWEDWPCTIVRLLDALEAARGTP